MLVIWRWIIVSILLQNSVKRSSSTQEEMVYAKESIQKWRSILIRITSSIKLEYPKHSVFQSVFYWKGCGWCISLQTNLPPLEHHNLHTQVQFQLCNRLHTLDISILVLQDNEKLLFQWQTIILFCDSADVFVILSPYIPNTKESKSY